MAYDHGLARSGQHDHAAHLPAEQRPHVRALFGGDVDAVVVDHDPRKHRVGLLAEAAGDHTLFDRPRELALVLLEIGVEFARFGCERQFEFAGFGGRCAGLRLGWFQGLCDRLANGRFEFLALLLLLLLCFAQAALFLLQRVKRALLPSAIAVELALLVHLFAHKAVLLLALLFQSGDTRINGHLCFLDQCGLPCTLLGDLVQVPAAFVRLLETAGGEEVAEPVVGTAVAVREPDHVCVVRAQAIQIAAQ